jgi:hypothetical protein
MPNFADTKGAALQGQAFGAKGFARIINDLERKALVVMQVTNL